MQPIAILDTILASLTSVVSKPLALSSFQYGFIKLLGPQGKRVLAGVTKKQYAAHDEGMNDICSSWSAVRVSKSPNQPLSQRISQSFDHTRMGFGEAFALGLMSNLRSQSYKL